MDTAAWLRGLGLPQYEEAFRANAIDADVLPTLTADDLKDIGVAAIGDRRRLLNAIAALRDGQQDAVAAAETPSPAAADAGRAPGAERRQLTVLFCDLVGSTELARRLDPEELGGIMRAYQNAVAGEVTRFEGHIAKYMGDGVLAYFGWPRAHEDEAERAVRAGLAIQDAIGRLAAPEPLAVRVGIATGLVMVGDLIGEGAAREEAVVGETPNLAARLQALAGPGTIVVADATRRLLGGLFELENLGAQHLKGFAGPVRAFRVLGQSAAESRFEARHGAAPLPLVGREQELALLLDRWAQARAGEGQVVLLAGEAGIGKSRLMLALRERLRQEPRTSLRYFCSPYHTNSALHPVIAQLERAAGFSRNDDGAAKAAKLEALFRQAAVRIPDTLPLAADLLSLPLPEEMARPEFAPQERKARTFAALLTQLEALAAERPLLMILEDAHWSDPTTLELFDQVVERIQRLPALLVVSFRLEFTPAWASHAHATPLSLNRLGERQVAAIVERVTCGRALPDEVFEQILAKTDGVPLFVEELTKAMLETGLLREEVGRYVLDRPSPPLAIPDTLHSSLLARLDRGAPIKEVAQTGAVIGRQFGHELVAAVAALERATLDDALRQLVAAGLVFRRGQPPDTVYVFKHALVQDAAYASLLKSRRQQLHARVAQVLEEGFPAAVTSEPEIVAHHLTEAGLSDRAVAFWLAAGRQAAERSANKESIAHLRRGLELLQRLAPTPSRKEIELDLLLALGPALFALRGYAAPEAGEVYRQAHQLSRHAHEVAHGSLLRETRKLLHRRVGEAVEAIYPERLMELVEALSDHFERGESVRLARAAGLVDGFYHLWSEGWRAQPPPAILRLYLPAAAGRELELAAALARHAPQALVWSAKFLCGRHGAGRRDPALLYLPRGEEDARWVAELLDTAAPLLGGPRVRMTARHRGAWLAADPGGGVSFGQALARALTLAAREPGALADPAALAAALAGRLDLEAPHLLRPGGSA
jgi:class 3 adenylate cyclase